MVLSFIRNAYTIVPNIAHVSGEAMNHTKFYATKILNKFHTTTEAYQ
jgi:hypothetical protein